MTTLQELDQFTRFAESKLQGNADELSLEDCLQLWRRQREEDETVVDIQQSLADCQAGRVKPVGEAFDNVRSRLENSQ